MYQQLYDLCKDKDLTQIQIEEIIGISQKGYSKYKTGKNNILTDILIKLANYYNTGVNYIATQINIKEWYKKDK